MLVKPGTTVHYIDVHGKERKLRCIERVEGLVKWRKGHSYSQVARYECEDGHVIQVPDDAWGLVKIIKETSAIKHKCD